MLERPVLTVASVSLVRALPNKKALMTFIKRALNKKRQRLTLPRFTAVPSALVVLTSLFGMGRGGPHRYSHPKLFSLESLVFSL